MGQEHIDAAQFQQQLNISFSDSLKSPLEQKDFVNFKGLDFFEIDSMYIVTARLVRTPDEKPFKMVTTTDRRPGYKKYGVLHFTIAGKDLKLNVYQNAEPRKPAGRTLFLPFTDNTSGDETYGGGRYIELEIPNGNETEIDFNKAYNPYCVYNKKYSCPVVPAENHLDIAVRAGVKKYDH